MLFAALLRCTSYNGNAIFSGNQSISFAQDSKVRAGLDGSRRVSRSRRTRRFAQDSTVLADRTRRFAQDSMGRAGLDGSRRTRRFSQTELDGSRRTRRFAQDSTLLAATAPNTDGAMRWRGDEVDAVRPRVPHNIKRFSGDASLVLSRVDCA